MTSISMKALASQRNLLPASASLDSHGKLQAMSFASLSTLRAKQGKRRRGKVGNTRISLDACRTFAPMQGIWRRRAGAERVVSGYTAEDANGDEAKSTRSTIDETLEMLGWPSLCATVAGFASTTTGKHLCQALTLPSTKDESQALLDETSAALEIDSILGGILDFGAIQTPVVEVGLDRVSKGVVISGKQLAAIATFLQVAETLQRGIASVLQEHKSKQDSLQPIARLIEPMLVHPEFHKLIWSKIDEDGIVKDTASAQVRQARIRANTLKQRLEELLNKLARQKSSDDDVQEVIDVDGRLCLFEPADQASSIPGLVFQRGSRAYLEPSEAVSLNNKLAEARAEVQSAEHDVLSGVTTKLLPHIDDLQFVFQSIVQLDLIAARGKYSSWIGGQKPIFVDDDLHMQHLGAANLESKFNGKDDRWLLVNLRKARHPLLVEQYRHAVSKAKAKVKGEKKSLGRMRARGMADLDTMKAAVAEAENEVAEMEARAPVPIDVRVSCGTHVVAITGPNTGGKTAAIMAVGLAALMAKVGLYVLAMDPVYIPWFDAVFADIGDEQSLGQSLSTFSGHLMRIKRIMTESTDRSLVLLDELGAGTDPTEGAALGMALLESFAAESLLTLATTHHGELKTLKYSDRRFENASVEFDEERLAPTYKLLWGIPGRSNALNVARRLGLPSEILVGAQSWFGAVSAELNQVIMKLEGAKLDFDQSLEDSETLTWEITESFSQLVASADGLYEHKKVLHTERSEKLAAIAGAARSRLGAVARKKNTKPLQSVGKGTISIHKEQTAPKEDRTDIPVPAIGQLVYVPKLGRDAKVVGVNASRKEITVQSGFLEIKVGLKEVQ